jgi:hypothetical protein
LVFALITRSSFSKPLILKKLSKSIKNYFSLFFLFIVCEIYAGDKIFSPSCDCRCKIDNLSSKCNLFADFLVLRADQFSTWGIAGNFQTAEVPGGSTNLTYTLNGRTVLFDWNFGIRTGIGYRFDHDLWDTQLRYTWYRTSGKDGARANNVTPAYLGQWLTFGLFLIAGKVDWHLLLNTGDWELGRDCFVGKGLSLRPHLGVKGASIRQSIHSVWEAANSATASENMKNNFWGIGPRGGVNSKWKLGCMGNHSIYFFGDTAFSFLGGFWTFKDKQKASYGSSINGINPKMGTGTFSFEALFGLGWDIKFNQNKSRFLARIGYEMQFWYNQLKVFTFMEGTLQSSLMLQGGMIDARFEF